jgi:hypothetical protein
MTPDALAHLACGVCGAVFLAIGVHCGVVGRMDQIERWLRAGGRRRARFIGLAIGAPLGVAIALFTAWLSRRP